MSRALTEVESPETHLHGEVGVVLGGWAVGVMLLVGG